MNSPFRCFILAAGFGERLRPITSHIPKPLLPFAGKPLIESILERIFALGPDKVGINMHYKKEMLSEWLEDSQFAGRLAQFPEDPILDTGGALDNARDFLSGSDFLVHNGDIISDINLASLIRHHCESGNIATLAVHDNKEFSNVIVGKNGFFKGIRKAENTGGSDRITAFTGIAVYSGKFLEFSPGGVSSVVTAWSAASSAGLPVGVFDVTGCYWTDIGNPSSYASAVIRSLKSEGESVYCHPQAAGCEEAEIEGSVIAENGSLLARGSSLKNCIVLPDGMTRQGCRYENSIIGPQYSISLKEDLFAERIGGKGALIGVGGSDRKYYRVREGASTAVLMECREDDPDYLRHIEYTLFLKKYGVPVPSIISSDEDKKSALFEDLGDISLYSWLKFHRSDDSIEKIYSKILDILAGLHCEASEHVSECSMLAERVFDYDYLRWETGYFIDRFVRGLMKQDLDDPALLDKEFHRLALIADAFPKRIIHRDFQSQNIMITKGGIPRVIDYQGARLAPSAYDVASILWDPYAPLNTAMRGRLLGYYLGAVGERNGLWLKTDEFRDSLLCCRLQRHMQALGAYGFLSVVKGKNYFLKYLPEGIRLLKEDAAEARADFPAVFRLVNSLI
jgi:NDP-sugar pyrophosphorylase family protein/aminoglycoside/choline kinase family phosphotransferase